MTACTDEETKISLSPIAEGLAEISNARHLHLNSCMKTEATVIGTYSIGIGQTSLSNLTFFITCKYFLPVRMINLRG